MPVIFMWLLQLLYYFGANAFCYFSERREKKKHLEIIFHPLILLFHATTIMVLERKRFIFYCFYERLIFIDPIKDIPHEIWKLKPMLSCFFNDFFHENYYWLLIIAELALHPNIT